MTKERDMTNPAETGDLATGPAAADPSVSMTRRALLRGASAAVPTVLTLKSGAALAQTSNLMGTVKDAGSARSPDGIQCIEVDRYMMPGRHPDQVDLGNNPMLHVQYVRQRVYYRTKQGAASQDANDRVTVAAMCRRGGTYWYRDGGPQQLVSYSPGGQQLKPGLMVSTTALHSFQSGIKARTYF